MIHPSPGAFNRSAITARRAELEGPSRPVKALGWMLAAILTLGVHASLYVLLTQEQGEVLAPQPSMPAAVMITLAPIAVAARSEVDNASTDAPAEASEQTMPEPAEAPPPPALDPIVDTPTPPPNVMPQAVLPQKPLKPVMPPKPIEPERPKKPVEKPVVKPKPKPVERPKKPQVATRAGGGPRSDRQTADVTAAPSAGSAVSEASRASWQNDVRARMVRAKRFPSEARGQTGVVVVSVTITPSGGASGVRLIQSSGNPAFDAEAAAAMQRAAPYPPPPTGKATPLTVPLVFRR